MPRSLLIFLLALTAIALLPWDPQGPFDARDWSRLDGVRLDYPWRGVLMEPLLAPAHALMGAPDFRLAGLSTALWLLAGATCAGALSGRGRSRLTRALAWGAFAAGAVALYTVFMAVLHLPGWRLHVDDGRWSVADLQTHTFGSHDGLVTAEQNLRWHRDRGYDLVAVTEHKDPAGSFAAQALARASAGLPAVIPGVEVRAEEEEFLLGIGLDPTRRVLPFYGTGARYAERFIADVHAQGGAVIALAWLLEPRHVHKLAAAGIDGIELVNTGHPDVPDAVRAAMLEVAASHQVLMIASTDWHGWGGFTRTWTLLQLPLVTGGEAQQTRATLDTLRARDATAVVPVAAGYMGEPGWWRVLLSPWVEMVRYAAELSPARVAAWWLWAFVLVRVGAWLKRRGLRPLPLFAMTASAGLGAAIAVRGVELVTYRHEGVTHPYALEIGGPVLALILIALAAAVLLAWNERRRWLRAQV